MINLTIISAEAKRNEVKSVEFIEMKEKAIEYFFNIIKEEIGSTQCNSSKVIFTCSEVNTFFCDFPNCWKYINNKLVFIEETMEIIRELLSDAGYKTEKFKYIKSTRGNDQYKYGSIVVKW